MVTWMVTDLPQFRDRARVFRDRAEAGRVLAGMLSEYRSTGAVVLAVPAGGVPVAAEIARALGLPLEVAVVSKITFPWNTEAGYGAVAWDGTALLNEEVLPHAGLSEVQVQEGLAHTAEKVARRVKVFRGDRPFPDLAPQPVILVDDGLASGFTMRVTVQAARHAGARTVVLAVPTAHVEAVRKLSGMVEAVYCPNIRRSRPFAVAEAYQNWYDVGEEEAKGAISAVTHGTEP
jgi:predicted phosphoribosyltransferase